METSPKLPSLRSTTLLANSLAVPTVCGRAITSTSGFEYATASAWMQAPLRYLSLAWANRTSWQTYCESNTQRWRSRRQSSCFWNLRYSTGDAICSIDQPQPARGVLCLFGGMHRSGTTLLADLLGTHDAVTPLYETDLLALLDVQWDNLQRGQVPTSLKAWETHGLLRHGKPGYESFIHGERHILFSGERVIAGCRRLTNAVRSGECPHRAATCFLDDLFDEHSRVAEKAVVVEKTPGNTLHLQLLFKLYPSAKFIFCVRDPAAVLQSPWMAARGHSEQTVLEGWKAHARCAWEAHSKGFSVYVVRYEDITGPSDAATKAVEGLLSYLGVSQKPAQAMVSNYQMRVPARKASSEVEADVGADQEVAQWLARFSRSGPLR